MLVAGEALIDVIHRPDGTAVETPGGGPANVAITLGRLGRAPRLMTSFGDDERGNHIRSWLEAAGVHVERTPQLRTSTATARLAADGSAQYAFDIDWNLDASVAGSPHILHIGSIASVLAPGADAVASLVDELRGAALISYDPNIRPNLIDDPTTTRTRVEALIARADVVKASDEDVAWIRPRATPIETAQDWVRAGAVLVVITQGSEGVIAVTSDQLLHISAVSVHVSDTVGAGDTFMGTLLDGLLNAGIHGPAARDHLTVMDRHRLEALLRRSAVAAAVTVSRPGADPPWRSELAAAMAASR